MKHVYLKKSPVDRILAGIEYTNNPQGIYFRLDLMPLLLLAYRDLMRAVRPETYPYILRKGIKSSLK